MERKKELGFGQEKSRRDKLLWGPLILADRIGPINPTIPTISVHSRHCIMVRSGAGRALDGVERAQLLRGLRVQRAGEAHPLQRHGHLHLRLRRLTDGIWGLQLKKKKSGSASFGLTPEQRK